MENMFKAMSRRKQLAHTRQMKIEAVSGDSLPINFDSSLASHFAVRRLAGRTVDSRCIIHLAAHDWCVQAKVNQTHGCHRWTRYVSLIIRRV
jgi:hypothetical protein